MAKIGFRRNINISRVISRLVNTIIALYVGGTIVTEVGDIMLGEQSTLYGGFELIGWTVNSTGGITDVSGTGILTVIGIVGIASIVMEFVKFSM